MPLDDLGEVNAQLRLMKKAIERIQPTAGGGDSDHPGSGDDSVQLGPDTNASGDYSTAVGSNAWATAVDSTAVGFNSRADGEDSLAAGSSASAEHDNSAAIGNNADTTAAWQIMLGTSFHTVVVPGTFSNPSARRLKENIVPAPELGGVFPELVEYEYIGDGRRRLGYIADDLVGTDMERFVTFDDDGRPNGIDYLSLLVVQVAQLKARVIELENKGA